MYNGGLKTHWFPDWGGCFLGVRSALLPLKQLQVGALSDVSGEEQGCVPAMILGPLVLPLLGRNCVPGVTWNQGLYNV